MFGIEQHDCRLRFLVMAGLIALLIGCESEEEARRREREFLEARQDSVQAEMRQEARLVADNFIRLYPVDEPEVIDTLWSLLSARSTEDLPQESVRGTWFLLNRLSWIRTHGLMDYEKGYAKPSDTETIFDTAWINIDSETFVLDSTDTVISVWYTVHSKWVGLRNDPRRNALLLHGERGQYKVYIGEPNEWEGL